MKKNYLQIILGLGAVAVIIGVVAIFNNGTSGTALPNASKQLGVIPQDYYNALVVSGNQSGNYDVNFSPNGSRVAYVVKNGNQSSVYVNGQAGPWYDDVSNIGWTNDSKHFHYTADKNNKSFVVIDNKQMPEQFDSIGAAIFSPTDSSVYAVENDTFSNYESSSYVYFNGHESPIYQNDDSTSIQSSLILSPDDSSVDYYVCSDGSNFTCSYVSQDANGNTNPDLAFENFNQNGADSWITFNPFGKGISFSPDGKINVHFDSLLLTSIVVNGIETIVPDDMQYKYKYIFDPIFSPDSKNMAYTVEACNQQSYGSCPIQGSSWYVVYNNTQEQEYQNISSLTFSPDGQSLAYWAEENGQWFVVVNQRELSLNLPSGARGGDLIFTPDSSNLYITYSDANDGKHVIDENGNKILDVPNENDYITYPAFVGSHFVYIEEDDISNSQSQMKLVVDGVAEGGYYTSLAPINSESSLYNPDSSSVYSLSPDGKGVVLGAVAGNQLWTLVEPLGN